MCEHMFALVRKRTEDYTHVTVLTLMYICETGRFIR